MTGEEIRKKIKAKGFTFRKVAKAMGESEQNFRKLLLSDNVKSATLERIAAAMGENVAYFYNAHPIFTIEDYVEYETLKRENELLRQIIRDKEALIEELRRNRL